MGRILVKRSDLSPCYISYRQRGKSIQYTLDNQSWINLYTPLELQAPTIFPSQLAPPTVFEVQLYAARDVDRVSPAQELEKGPILRSNVLCALCQIYARVFVEYANAVREQHDDQTYSDYGALTSAVAALAGVGLAVAVPVAGLAWIAAGASLAAVGSYTLSALDTVADLGAADVSRIACDAYDALRQEMSLTAIRTALSGGGHDPGVVAVWEQFWNPERFWTLRDALLHAPAAYFTPQCPCSTDGCDLLYPAEVLIGSNKIQLYGVETGYVRYAGTSTEKSLSARYPIPPSSVGRTVKSIGVEYYTRGVKSVVGSLNVETNRDISGARLAPTATGTSYVQFGYSNHPTSRFDSVVVKIEIARVTNQADLNAAYGLITAIRVCYYD